MNVFMYQVSQKMSLNTQITHAIIVRTDFSHSYQQYFLKVFGNFENTVPMIIREIQQISFLQQVKVCETLASSTIGCQQIVFENYKSRNSSGNQQLDLCRFVPCFPVFFDLLST